MKQINGVCRLLSRKSIPYTTAANCNLIRYTNCLSRGSNGETREGA